MIETNLTSTESGIKPHMYSHISSTSYKGIYHSNSINKSPAEVYSFCQNQGSLNQIFSDLPEKIKNFLDLEFVKAESVNDEMFRVEWRNKLNSDIQGTLSLTMTPAPSNKGTVVIANAIFGDYSMDNEEPSDLINVFLKRMKALVETGQLATIRSQPNGKDEEEMKNKNPIQH